MANPSDLPARLLAWYDRHRRALPWRSPPGEVPEPYRVWLSEVMLQQTTVGAVIPYYHAFLQKWPTVEVLAAASLEEVRTAWAGLGYYSRAANLHACAQQVASQLDGQFPETEEGLRALPGIGAYTAAAVAAIAFDRPAAVVDGNVERVMARLHAVETPLPAAKSELRSLAAALTPSQRPGDYAQAVMDLGATVCTPTKPKCLLCPWEGACRGHALGIAEELPHKSPKAERSTRRGTAFWVVNPEGAVLLRRRAEKGLLRGMTELPSTPWRERAGFPDADEIAEAAPLPLAWTALPGVVRHTFTHFHLELALAHAATGSNWADADGFWVFPDRFGDHALPSVMRKLVRHALAHVA